jgi:hypothetical protein
MLLYARRASFLSRIENGIAAGGCLVFGTCLYAFEQHPGRVGCSKVSVRVTR